MSILPEEGSFEHKIVYKAVKGTHAQHPSDLMLTSRPDSCLKVFCDIKSVV